MDDKNKPLGLKLCLNELKAGKQQLLKPVQNHTRLSITEKPVNVIDIGKQQNLWLALKSEISASNLSGKEQGITIEKLIGRGKFSVVFHGLLGKASKKDDKIKIKSTSRKSSRILNDILMDNEINISNQPAKINQNECSIQVAIKYAHYNMKPIKDVPPPLMDELLKSSSVPNLNASVKSTTMLFSLLSEEYKTQVRNAISRTTSDKEIFELEYQLKTGTFPFIKECRSSTDQTTASSIPVQNVAINNKTVSNTSVSIVTDESGLLSPRSVFVQSLTNVKEESIPPIRVTEEFLNEIRILKEFQNERNIVQIIGVLTVPRLAIIMEYMDCDLHRCLTNETWQMETSFLTRISILNDILSGLATLHSHNYIHRDLKPHNILVQLSDNSNDQQRSLVVKLADFGSACKLVANSVPKDNPIVGTSGYTAPEIYSGGEYGTPSDIFSFAIITWELFLRSTSCSLRRNPLSGLDADKTLDAMITGVRPIFNEIDHPLVIQSMTQSSWDFNPSKRPTATVLLHTVDNLLSSPCTSDLCEVSPASVIALEVQPSGLIISSGSDEIVPNLIRPKNPLCMIADVIVGSVISAAISNVSLRILADSMVGFVISEATNNITLQAVANLAVESAFSVAIMNIIKF